MRIHFIELSSAFISMLATPPSCCSSMLCHSFVNLLSLFPHLCFCSKWFYILECSSYIRKVLVSFLHYSFNKCSTSLPPNRQRHLWFGLFPILFCQLLPLIFLYPCLLNLKLYPLMTKIDQKVHMNLFNVHYNPFQKVYVITLLILWLFSTSSVTIWYSSLLPAKNVKYIVTALEILLLLSLQDQVRVV